MAYILDILRKTETKAKYHTACAVLLAAAFLTAGSAEAGHQTILHPASTKAGLFSSHYIAGESQVGVLARPAARALVGRLIQRTVMELDQPDFTVGEVKAAVRGQLTGEANPSIPTALFATILDDVRDVAVSGDGITITFASLGTFTLPHDESAAGELSWLRTREVVSSSAALSGDGMTDLDAVTLRRYLSLHPPDIIGEKHFNLQEANERGVVLILLAGGKGSRFESEQGIPKNLAPFRRGGPLSDEKPMVQHLLDAAGERDIQSILVVGHRAPEVMAAVGNEEYAFVMVDKPMGTGHGIYAPSTLLQGYTGDIIIAYGDVPGVDAGLLERIERENKKHRMKHRANYGGMLVSGVIDDAGAYGRIVREAKGTTRGSVQAIVERKIINGLIADGETMDLPDKTSTSGQALLRIGEYNSGVGMWPANHYFDVLADSIGNHLGDDKFEWFTTDSVEALVRRGFVVEGYRLEEPDDLLSIAGANTVEELTALQRAFDERHERRAAGGDGISVSKLLARFRSTTETRALTRLREMESYFVNFESLSQLDRATEEFAVSLDHWPDSREATSRRPKWYGALAEWKKSVWSDAISPDARKAYLETVANTQGVLSEAARGILESPRIFRSLEDLAQGDGLNTGAADRLAFESPGQPAVSSNAPVLSSGRAQMRAPRDPDLVLAELAQSLDFGAGELLGVSTDTALRTRTIVLADAGIWHNTSLSGAIARVNAEGPQTAGGVKFYVSRSAFDAAPRSTFHPDMVEIIPDSLAGTPTDMAYYVRGLRDVQEVDAVYTSLDDARQHLTGVISVVVVGSHIGDSNIGALQSTQDFVAHLLGQSA